MSSARYRTSNDAKASFDAAYLAPTPHRYLANMTAVEYRLPEQMQPFLTTAVEASGPGTADVTVLDLGCSYGTSAALLKTNCRYEEFLALYRRPADSSYDTCVRETRTWLDTHAQRDDVAVVGMDSSRPAVDFASDAGLIDHGIACNLEARDALDQRQRESIAQCTVLFSAGTIGYVTDRTMAPVLESLGTAGHSDLGPIAILSVLELFEPDPIADTFSAHGYRFDVLPFSVQQRRFADDAERSRVGESFDRGLLLADTPAASDHLFADVCVAARPDHFETVAARITETARALPAVHPRTRHLF